MPARNADAVMAARGDLGVEIDFARLPLVQRRIAAETAGRLDRTTVAAGTFAWIQLS